MSEENNLQELVAEAASRKPVNTRGEVGPGTNGKRLKALHRLEGRGQSMKQFMRSIAKDNPDVKLWFDCKRELFNKKRSEANISIAKLCASASKNARRKKKTDNTPKVSD